MTSNRLDQLKRRQAGQSIRLSIEEALAGKVGLPRGLGRFLTLEESDSLRLRRRERFVPRHEQDVPGRIRCGIERQISLERLPFSRPPINCNDDIIYISFLDSDVVGLYALSAADLCEHWRALVPVFADGFEIIDSGIGNMVVLQVLDSSSGEVLDLAAWGADWSDVVREMG